jgi:hypothetical protein
MSPSTTGDPRPDRRPTGEAVGFALVFTVAYAALAVFFFQQTPSLYEHLDQLFDADLGLWTIDLARPQGPHTPTSVHPLFLLFFKPIGTFLRRLLRGAGVRLAARLAAALLCAIAGGAAVGAFRILLHRLGVPAPRARPWTLVFALSATQMVFSSLPESFAFSALSLILVFAVAAGPRPAGVASVVAGVFSFGITVTNLAAVALARASSLDWHRGARRATAVTGRHLTVVLLVAAVLGIVQWLVYPRARPFFVPEIPGAAYQRSFIRSASPSFLAARSADVASHLLFTGLAAPQVVARQTHTTRVVTDFAPRPLLRPRWSSALHGILWAALLALAVRGLVRQSSLRRGVVVALVAWLAMQAGLHFVFGTSLFLYSGHWVFALVAATAVGLEAEASASTGRGRAVQAAAVTLVALQVAANATLVADIVRIYSRR